ncbi:MAG TPA: dihydroneopterin aldolase [Acetobacteraceae bacterium]|nr:dihydroneopterin aldolase [Acetobacteraceae bacterium]
MSLEPDAAAGLRVVFVRGLELRASLGVHPHEKAAAQRVVIDVELAVRDEAAPSGVGEDDLRRTVDYAAVVRAATAIVAEGHTLLVETLAEKIARAALVDPRVARARVSVEKPDAFTETAGVGAIIERMRD